LQHSNHSFPATGKKTLPKAHLLNPVGPSPFHHCVLQPDHLPQPTGAHKLHLSTAGERGKIETSVLTNIPNQGQRAMTNRSATKAEMEAIQKGTELLQQQLEQALAKIEQNVQKSKDLAEQISRSPRAVKTIQALEAAIAIFGRSKPNLEYEVSQYATGNKCWRQSPAQHPVPIQDLLLYDVQAHQDKNTILVEKVTRVVRQNLHLAQQASRANETPSERLKKDPIMGLVTKTVATYMFLKHNNEQKPNNNLEKEDFSSWGQPFLKRRSESKRNQKK
jgi:hypothetical protein